MVPFVPAIDHTNAERARIAAKCAEMAQIRVAFSPTLKPKKAMRVTLKHHVSDVTRLPSALIIVQPNDAEIRRLFCAGWKEGDPVPNVPGVNFIVKRNPVPTGRR